MLFLPLNCWVGLLSLWWQRPMNYLTLVVTHWISSSPGRLLTSMAWLLIGWQHSCQSKAMLPVNVRQDVQRTTFVKYKSFQSSKIGTAWQCSRKVFFWSSDSMSDDLEQIIWYLEKNIRHFNLIIHGKVLRWSDNMSDDFEQIIRHFTKSSKITSGVSNKTQWQSSHPHIIYLICVFCVNSLWHDELKN